MPLIKQIENRVRLLAVIARITPASALKKPGFLCLFGFETVEGRGNTIRKFEGK